MKGVLGLGLMNGVLGLGCVLCFVFMRVLNHVATFKKKQKTGLCVFFVFVFVSEIYIYIYKVRVNIFMCWVRAVCARVYEIHTSHVFNSGYKHLLYESPRWKPG
jgi:glucan phosphoethanolaminetransferase (alkaline phosphatase superfamily)